MAFASAATPNDGFSQFLIDLRKRVAAGDPDIPIRDFERHEYRMGTGAALALRAQWSTAKSERELRDLIAECTAPLAATDGVIEMLARNNRLLAAILRKLSKP